MQKYAVAVLCLVGASPVMAADSATAAPALTEESARKIAMEKLEGSRVVKSETRTYHDGSKRFTYVLVNEKNRAKVVLDGDSGEMVKFNREPIESVDLPRRFLDGAEAGDTNLSMDDAREAALKRVGGGEVVKIEKDYHKDGSAVYEVEIISSDTEYELDIDADSGEILKYESKRLDGEKLRKKERKEMRKRHKK